MKKALMVATIGNFLAGFELNDMKLLQNLGYEVHCAANMNDISDIRNMKLTSQGIKKHHICFSRNPFSKDNLKAYREIKDLIISEKFEIVHCHTPVAGVLCRLAAHKCKVKKIIYTAHGFHFYTGAPLKNWIVYYPIEKICSRYTDCLVTINKEDYKRASEKLFAKKTIYSPGIGIDTDRFRSGERDKIRKELGIDKSEFMLFSAGELNKNKNHESVIVAVEGMNLTYVIAGKGELEGHLKMLAQERGVKLILAGYRNDIADFYAAADAYILPSIREGLNVSLMEAMASGLPCLAGRIRGNIDLIDERGGYLFDPLKKDEIKQAIQKIMIADRFSFGEYNKRKIKTFDYKKVHEVMKQVYL